MEIELSEIKNHMMMFPPFRRLPEDALDETVKEIEVSYFRAGTVILEHGQQNHHLFYIRSGAIEIRRSNGDFYNRIGEGEMFGQFSVLRGKSVRYPARAIEDTLVYIVPEKQFHDLFDRFDCFSDFIEEDHGTRLKSAINRNRHGSDNPLLKTAIKKLIQRDIVWASPKITTQEAAQIMTRERVSALIIMSDRNSSIEGLITDRDIRNRVVAKGLSLDTPAEMIMSKDVISQNVDDYAFEAMLTMIRHNLYHLPVLKGKKPVGLITVSDIVQYETHGSIYMNRDIFRQQDVDGLSKISDKITLSFMQLVNEGADSNMVGSAMSGVGRNISARLLQLGEKKFGPPPVPYCFITLGSMAREDQVIVTDQDNALIMDNAYDHTKHNTYFESLANFVCDGLDRCGYTLCKGDIMATNPKWRMTLNGWKNCFTGWIEDPNPEALLNSSIFFDLCGIHGDLDLPDSLTKMIRQKAQKNRRFLSCLSVNALMRKPPLGFFRQFVMEPNGEHKNTFNIKRRGTAPITDLIRVHALSCGSQSLNSLERIDDIDDAGIFQDGVVNDLRDAMEYISIVRIRHQAAQIEAGKTPDNNLSPDSLSSFERRHLKDAFNIVNKQQASLRARYKYPVRQI